MTEIYRRCPKYGLGGNRCCGAHHQGIRDKNNGVTFEISYLDGREAKIGKAYYLPEPELDIDHHEWVTRKQESEDVVALYGECYLSTQTENSLREIHPGFTITRLYQDCPFRLASFRRKNLD